MVALELALHVCLVLLPGHFRMGRVRLADAGPELAAAALFVAVCVLAGRTRPGDLAPWLAIAATGRLVAFAAAGPWMARPADPSHVALAAVACALTWVGLRHALEGGPVARSARVVLGWLGFWLPMLAVQWALAGGRWRGGWQLWQWAALAALTLCASLIPRRTANPPAFGLRATAVWTVAAALLASGIAPGREWLRERRRAEVKAELSALESAPRPAGPGRDWFQRGVNFTANGISYESPLARRLLAELPMYGVSDVAVVPYGFVDRETGSIRTGAPDSWESDDGVRLIAAEAHRLGMRVLLKPHVWRPQSEPLKSPEARRAWLKRYEPFLVHYAQLATKTRADLFCIGVELAAVSGEEAEWRRLIALVKAHYSGPLVYAATQGAEFETVRFWDALDYIGLDNYYPLGDGYDTRAMMASVEAVQRRYKKPVLLTEAGYSSSPGAHRTPWDDRRTGAVDLQEQVKCYEALYRAFHHRPWFRGVYWWKIETDRTGGPAHPGMAPWNKPAMEAVRRWNRLAHVSETGPAAVSPGRR